MSTRDEAFTREEIIEAVRETTRAIWDNRISEIGAEHARKLFAAVLALEGMGEPVGGSRCMCGDGAYRFRCPIHGFGEKGCVAESEEA